MANQVLEILWESDQCSCLDLIPALQLSSANRSSFQRLRRKVTELAVKFILHFVEFFRNAGLYQVEVIESDEGDLEEYARMLFQYSCLGLQYVCQPREGDSAFNIPYPFEDYAGCILATFSDFEKLAVNHFASIVELKNYSGYLFRGLMCVSRQLSDTASNLSDDEADSTDVGSSRRSDDQDSTSPLHNWLRPDTALIEFSLYKNRYQVTITTSDDRRLAVRFQETAAKIQSDINTFNKISDKGRLTRSSLAKAISAGRRLAKLFFAPIMRAIGRSARELIFVLHPSLAALNFDDLPLNDVLTHFVVDEDYVISYIHDQSAVLQQMESHFQPVQDPVRNACFLVNRDLPYARSESLECQRALFEAGVTSRHLTGQRACNFFQGTSQQASMSGIIQIAAQAEEASFCFGNESTVLANEVQPFSLDGVQLAVVASNHSSGMEEALMRSGCKSILSLRSNMALRQDQEVAQLLVSFYKNLSRGLGRAEALRDAKREVKQTYRDDKKDKSRIWFTSWAGWRLCGQSGPLSMPSA